METTQDRDGAVQSSTDCIKLDSTFLSRALRNEIAVKRTRPKKPPEKSWTELTESEQTMELCRLTEVVKSLLENEDLATFTARKNSRRMLLAKQYSYAGFDRYISSLYLRNKDGQFSLYYDDWAWRTITLKNLESDSSQRFLKSLLSGENFGSSARLTPERLVYLVNNAMKRGYPGKAS